MNKTQLIDAVAASTGRSKADVAAIIAATLDTVQEAVAAGDTVQIIGFGSFERRPRKGGERRTPQGGTVHVEAKHVPAFKAGAGFKQAVSA
ncbi:HU family DNA-binding protein [Nonomuraea sp. SBT364]|uniref:HU family DNA-binding protein n=1 Tax=Nonomuraea sp. SBT364 TaxID=1580530 RepID=UPI00066AEC75|nr:HU family DNA-binding protein [Nonomuraea sp. SBT364]